MQVATSTRAPSLDEQPLRLLLVRSRPGELPWLAITIAKSMAPVEIVEVIGFANAIWRLGNEAFDSVLLDVELRDPAAMAYFREQMADVGAVPVLDLRDPVTADEAAVEPGTRAAARVREPAALEAKAVRRGLRVPWQRRPRRASSRPAEPVPATG